LNLEGHYEIESIVIHRICRHGSMKYLVHWRGWADADDSWELQEDFIADTSTEVLKTYWKRWEKNYLDAKASDTVIRDVQGELECPRFHNEPERLYRKR